MVERQSIVPFGVAPNPNLAPGMQVGNLLFISGHVGADADGHIPEGCEAQSRQIMENIRGVVEAAGGRMEDAVKVTCFLTKMEDYATYAKVRQETWPKDPPASSTLGVSALVRPELVVEVEAIIYIPD